MAGGEHAVGIAVAAVTREPHRAFHAREGRTVALVHQERAGGEQHRLGQARAVAHAQIAVAARTAVAGGAAIAGEALARERLAHHPVNRLAEPRQRDQRTPGRHPGNEGLGAVDRIEHPDIFGVGALRAELLPDHAVLREGAADQLAHRAFGGAVGGRHRIEAAAVALVLDRQRCAEEWKNGLAGHIGELIDEDREIHCRHGRSFDCDASPGIRNSQGGQNRLLVAIA